ncbi:hypothetical protein [Natrinema salinisoli]|uniref:hypothetical protein n=1 Tax=Natrinema salinisoli TaxID=2878535 RepID=UPI001CF06E2A|nr:hypothetical protein [Natrinema salinisoli]
MPDTICDRCGTEYDTDRETSQSSFDSMRCPSCGKQNSPPVAETDGGTLEVPANESVPETIRDTLTTIEGDGKELHVHFHFHG